MTTTEKCILAILAAAVIFACWLGVQEWRADGDCIKWQTVGAPTYIKVGSALFPVNNRQCIERRSSP